MASKPRAVWDFRSCVAFLMASVAFLGALAAFEAATAGDRLSAATRLLDEGQVLALDKRQFYLESVARNAAYADRARALGDEATAVERISNNRVVAQEDRAAERLIERYARYYYQADIRRRSLEGDLEKWTANALGALGFNVSWQSSFDDPKTSDEPDIWGNERAAITGIGTDFKLLALAVALYVLTMLFLTAADLTHGRRRVGLLFAGIVTATLATVLFATRVNDTPSFGPLPTVGLLLLGVIVGGAFAIVAVARATSSAEEPELDVPAAEFGPTDFIGSRLFTRLTEGSFSQTVVITIALTAFASAGCAYLYSHAAAQMYRESSSAMLDQAQEFRESTRLRAQANYLVENVEHLQEDQVRYDAAVQAFQLAREGLLRTSPATLGQEVTLRAQIYRADEKLADDRVASLTFSAKDPSSILRDAQFPYRLISGEATLSSDRAFALWDADNQRSAAYQEQASLYLLCLTLFAISLYLFGQSLGIPGMRPKQTLATFAAVLAAVALISGVFVYLRGSAPVIGVRNDDVALPADCQETFLSYKPDTAEKNSAFFAAEHYACGRRLETLARAPGDFAQAAAQFELAMQYRPHFALAESEDAETLGEAASPQGNVGFRSLPGPDLRLLNRIVNEESDAYERLKAEEFVNPQLMADYGFDLFQRGLLMSNRGEVASASKLIDESLALYVKYDDTEAWDDMNHALLLAALGRFDDATTVYRAIGSRKSDSVTPDMALGGMTDLEFLRAQCSRVLAAAACDQLNAQIPQWKAQLAAAVGAWHLPAVAASKTGLVKVGYAQVTPGGGAWGVVVPPQGSSGRVLAVWYKLDPTWNVWAAQPQLQNDPVDVVHGIALQFDSALEGSGFDSCLDGGRYRADFYLNGAPAGDWIGNNPLSGYVPNFDSRLNLAVCAPPNWQSDARHSWPGLATLTYAPGHRGGFVMMRRDYPEPVNALTADRVAVRELGVLSHAQVQPPSDPLPCAGALEWRQHWYGVDGDTVLVMNRIDEDNELYEGFFFSGGSRADAAQCAAASSFSEFERRPANGLAYLPPVQHPQSNADVMRSWTGSGHYATPAHRLRINRAPMRRTAVHRATAHRSYGSTVHRNARSTVHRASNVPPWGRLQPHHRPSSQSHPAQPQRRTFGSRVKQFFKSSRAQRSSARPEPQRTRRP